MKNTVMFNRPAFTQKVFNSSGLTVLTSLFQHFPKAGAYDMIVRRGQSVVARTSVCVEGSACDTQRNIDLSKLSPPDGGYKLNEGGVLGFFVSQGTNKYSVTIKQVGEKEKHTLLDSAEAVSEGGMFAVTLVRPGTYTMRDLNGKSRGQVHVRMPKREKGGEPYSPAKAATVEVDGKGNFKPNAVNIFAGQSVVFICQTDANLEVAFDDSDDDDVPPIEIDQKYTRRPRPKIKHDKATEDKKSRRPKKK